MRLSPGDRIALFAPSGAVSEEELRPGIEILEEWGLKVYIPERIFETHRYLAGTDENRAREFRKLFLCGDFRALWAARGGFGALKILPYLQDLKPPPTPPVLLGFSDVSILLNYLFDRFQIPSWHAPTVSYLARLTPKARWRIKALLLGREKFRTTGLPLAKGLSENGIKEVVGFLCGGNLVSLASLLGTPYFPDLTGKILILEETNEKLYRLDRLFAQLALAGVFKKILGLVIGDLCGLSPESYLPLLKEVLPEGLPVGLGFKIGHIPETKAFPLGIKARLTVSGSRAELVEVD